MVTELEAAVVTVGKSNVLLVPENPSPAAFVTLETFGIVLHNAENRLTNEPEIRVSFFSFGVGA